MPQRCRARPPQDAAEECRVRRLARRRLGPRDCLLRARMVALSGDGHRTPDIAAARECQPQTVRERIARFNAAGVDGLRDHPRPGRRRRVTAAARRRVIRLVASAPPGRLVRHGARGAVAEDEAREAHWPLAALAAAAQRAGIGSKRSQLRRILRAAGVRWRQPRAWAARVDPAFDPQGPRS